MVRPDRDRIGGRVNEHVEVDETWVGGRTRGEGRGVHHKTLVACAVEVLRREPGCTKPPLACTERRFPLLLLGVLRRAAGAIPPPADSTTAANAKQPRIASPAPA